MGRNEPCWCGQGIKWKRCHAGREDQPPFNVFDVEDDARKRGRKGYCSHSYAGDGCSNKIIRSHTVQRNGGLTAIAEGKSGVLSVKANLRAMIDHNGNPPPIEVGIGDASVFPGFCGTHDNDIFKPIEGKDIGLTAKEALLFAYRAIAYERFTKAVQVANVPIQRQMDRGQPLQIQEAIQVRCHLTEAGARRGLTEVETLLDKYRERVESGQTEGFHYRAYRFDTTLPLVGCGGYMPELAIDGTRLQHLARGTAALEQLTLTITSYAGKSVAMFAWIGPENGPSGTYLDAFDQLLDADKPDALVQIAFEQMENIFLRKSWWEGLPAGQRADLTRRIRSGVGLNVRAPGYYERSAPLLAEAGLGEEARG
jgi:hypothetical protein